MQNSETYAQEVRTWTTRRFVKVAPPTVHAGIGNALRHAYHMDGENRSLKNFEELLSRI